MDIYKDDIDAVAEYLASLAWVIRLALEHPANLCRSLLRDYQNKKLQGLQ